MDSTQLEYRKAAVEGANGLDLLLAMYDALISDVRRAADAQRRGDIARRGREMNHALLVLGFIQSWIDSNSKGELAQQLLAFYSRLRSSFLTAQARQSAEALEQCLPELFALRTVWEEVQLRAPEVSGESPERGSLLRSSNTQQIQSGTRGWSA